MKSRGRLVVGIRSAEKMNDLPVTKHNFRLYAPAAVKELLMEAGFNEMFIEHRDRTEKIDSVMIVAHA